MTEAEVIEYAREGFTVMLKVSAPALMAGLAVGLLVSIFQAATQLQEMTLTFVPKVVTIFLTLVIAAPFMLHTLEDFFRQMMDRIIAGG